MLDYIIYQSVKFKCAVLKFLFRMLCNFIPNKDLRKRTRNAFNNKYCQPPKLQDRVVLLNEVDHFPTIKKSRSINNDKSIKTAFTLNEIKQSPLVGTRIDPTLLDEAKILKIYDNFAWDKANYKKP